jgi:signal transduction histidine kinase
LLDEQGHWTPISRDTPVYIPDTAEEPAWISFPLRSGENSPRSVIRVPLIINGEPVGAFSISSRTPNFYSHHHVQLTTALGPYVTQALHNARLFAAERDRARAAVELANIQNDFVAGTSHELRTPLTAILGFTQLLETYWTELDEAQRLAGVKRIALAANRQLRLVEDLLLLTTLDSRTLVSESHAVAIAPLARQAVAEVQASYDDQPIALIGAADVMVQADPSRVLQILCNLLDNASKYSPEGTGVQVSWREEDEGVVLRVRDHGPGISDEGRQYLFTRFGRVPGSRMRAGRIGTGLGLYLGRELAEAMGGRLDLEATSADGTVFRLELPYAEPAAVR